MRKYLLLGLNVVAFVAATVLAITHFEYHGTQTIIYAGIATIIGFYLGQWTCHFHRRTEGFWITLGVFVCLNLLHSMIDGASIGGYSFIQGLVVLSHELGRQPALYLVLWSMMAPFVSWRDMRLAIVPVAVTGVWLLGVYLGRETYSVIASTQWLESMADMAVFLFLGDIIHHLTEEYRKIRYPQKCCH